MVKSLPAFFICL